MDNIPVKEEEKTGTGFYVACQPFLWLEMARRIEISRLCKI